MSALDWVLLGALLGVCTERLVPSVISRAGELVVIAAAVFAAEALSRGAASALGLLAGFATGVGLQMGLYSLLRGARRRRLTGGR